MKDVTLIISLLIAIFECTNVLFQQQLLFSKVNMGSLLCHNEEKVFNFLLNSLINQILNCSDYTPSLCNVLNFQSEPLVFFVWKSVTFVDSSTCECRSGKNVPIISYKKIDNSNLLCFSMLVNFSTNEEMCISEWPSLSNLIWIVFG